MPPATTLLILLGALTLIIFCLLVIIIKQAQDRKKFSADISRQIYQLTILKELGERIGYSLNVEKIVDIIINSLENLLSYSTVSYLLFNPHYKPGESFKPIIVKFSIKESVNRSFIDEVEARMLKSISALSAKEWDRSQTEEVISGQVIDEKRTDPVRSYFNIPLVINEKLVGLLTVASVEPGLYKQEETNILYAIVGQASTAVSRLEQILEVEKGKLASTIASMSDGVLMIDMSGQLALANPKAAQLLNVNSSPLTIFEVIKSFPQQVDLTQLMEQVKKSPLPVIANEVQMGKKIVRIYANPVKDNQNNNIGVVIILHDITKEKELEKLRQNFTAMIVHELRSPLTVVRGTADTIMKHVQQLDEPTRIKLLAGMFESASSMLQMVDDLLDTAKIQAGRFEVKLKKESPIPIIEDRIGYYQILAKDRGLTLSGQVSKNLPDLPIDADRIKQVLNNLLSNAIKFTPAGGQIVVSALVDASSMTVAVRDTGIGIGKEAQVKLFTPFEQVTEMKDSAERGTGLGLTVAKGIIEAHEGKIWVESQESQGSTFYFSLPLA